MTALRGRAHGARAVLARAAILAEDERGRPTLDAELLALGAQRHRRGEGDMDVILVAADPLYALLLRLPPGLALAGVVAEWDLRDPPLYDVPVLSGVADARETISEGEWLILDPTRARVLVGPDAAEIARLQTDSRPRVLLGAAHVPARTQGGQEVAVWARVAMLADVEEALAAGADGLAIDPGEELLPFGPLSEDLIAPIVRIPAGKGEREEPPAPVLPRALAQAVEMAGGGDVALMAGLDILEARAVVSLAGRCRLRWILSPGDLPVPPHRLRDALTAQARLEEGAFRPAGVPLICALLASVPQVEEEGAGSEPDLGEFEEAMLFPFADEELAELTLSTTLRLPPLRVVLTGGDITDDDPLPALPYAVAAAVRGVIVPARLVAVAKERIRALQ